MRLQVEGLEQTQDGRRGLETNGQESGNSRVCSHERSNRGTPRSPNLSQIRPGLLRFFGAGCVLAPSAGGPFDEVFRGLPTRPRKAANGPSEARTFTTRSSVCGSQR